LIVIISDPGLKQWTGVLFFSIKADNEGIYIPEEGLLFAQNKPILKSRCFDTENFSSTGWKIYRCTDVGIDANRSSRWNHPICQFFVR